MEFRLLVKVVLLDIVTDGKRNIVLEWLMVRDPTADLARGDLEQGCIHVMNLGTDSRQLVFQVFKIWLFSGTAHDTHPVRGIQQLLGLVPGWKITQRVSTEDRGDICLLYTSDAADE